MTDVQLRQADASKIIQAIVDPEIGRTFGQLEMFKGVRFGEEGTAHVQIELPTPAYPDRERLTRAIENALRGAGAAGTSRVDVTYSSRVRGKNTGGPLGLKIGNIVAVGSGKGGVGKSTIAACLAYGLDYYGRGSA